MGDLGKGRAGKPLAHTQGQVLEMGRHVGRQGILDLFATQDHGLGADLAQVLQLGAQVLIVLALELAALDHRQADVAHLRQSDHPQPFLHRLRTAFARHDPGQDLDLLVALPDKLDVAALGGLVDLLPDVGDQVGRGQDRTVGAGQQRRAGDLVVPDEQADRAAQLFQRGHEEGHIARRVLHADHMVEGQSHPLGRPPLKVGAGALGDVVQHHRQLDLVHLFVMVEHLVEGRL